MDKLNKIIGKIVNTVTNSVSQTSAQADSAQTFIPDGMGEALRAAAAEGIVMIENQNRVLPFQKGTVVSVFGRVQYDYFAVGYGSGGDVNRPYLYNLTDGLDECADLCVNRELAEVYRRWVNENPRDDGYWGHWPRCHPEMPVDKKLAEQAAAVSDAAVVVLGRSSGEDRENTLEKGSFYLTDAETDLLDKVCSAFQKVVILLNTGSIMEPIRTEKYSDTDLAVLYVWQGGMESGRAIADVLSGRVNPSGKLADTIACRYEDYPAASNFGAKQYNNHVEDIFIGYRYFETFAPEKVLYPFGFGLSYTQFDIQTEKAGSAKGQIRLQIGVTNTGDLAGREVVQVYYGVPHAALSAPKKSLIAFAKTKLLAPGETQILKISFAVEHMASYDDAGKTGNRSCYVLHAGSYPIYVGNQVRSAEKVYDYKVKELKVTERLAEHCAVEPKNVFHRLTTIYGKTGVHAAYESVPVRTVSRKSKISAAVPAQIIPTGDMGYKLSDVSDGKISLEKFVAQLSDRELEALTRGDYTMNSSLGVKGNAAVFGGVEESLRIKGVTPVTTTDGPSGIRLAATASLLPIGAALACSWDLDAVQRIYDLTGAEMAAKGSHVLLAPGMNIHRDPLCGRNFEYFSEDPVLTGLMGAAVVRGLQRNGVSACPKHFACNSQETNRTHNDSRLSERALREIYLKGFEICVKTAKPRNMMTSYNKINGVWSHYNYELITCILRGEWGYEGCVMTDWWMRAARDPDFPKLRDNAYRVRGGIDVLMPGVGPGVNRKAHYDRSLLESLGKRNGITRGEIQNAAMHTLQFVMNSYPFRVKNGLPTDAYAPGHDYFTVERM